ncbi:hypothetical protein C8R47DRAFT_52006, partial [Mycena vitilis]
MKSSLKGSDALLVRVSELLGLETSLKAVYSDSDRGSVMLNRVLSGELDIPEVEGSIIDEIHQNFSGEIIERDEYDVYSRSSSDVTEVTWITQMSNLIDLEATFISYGNEASLGYIYGDLALVVDVPAA